MVNTVGSLNNLERSIVLGSILGDGYLRLIPGRSEAFLECNHSFKAKDYVDFKYKSLWRLCKSAPKKRFGNGNRITYRFFTKQSKELTNIFHKFYSNGRKVVPNGLKLNPLILAVWYMDDGSKSRSSDVYLNSQQFSVKDQKKLIYALKEVGIRARLNKDKKYHRLRILKESINDFMKMISPHIIDSMRYKLVMTP